MVMPRDVASVIDRLRQSGYEAYAVGGCVRDSLLGREPKDWDVTTSALPEEVKEVFKRTIDTGIKHGTVTVMVNGVGIEVTTYRIDGEYLDGRHPEDVIFTSSLKEDLRRRDFTINAFVYNENEGVKDLFNGIDDLKNRIIRCVGDPEERFGEDGLRILRAIRFSAVLDFDIEPGTYNAAVKLAGNLKKVSAERIKTELDKIILSDNPGHILLLSRMKIAPVIFEELEAVREPDELTKSLEISDKKLPLRWAVLLHYIEAGTESGKNTDADFKASGSVMSRLKFDNKTTDKVFLFLDVYRKYIEMEEKGENTRIFCRRLLNLLGEENIFDFLGFVNALSLLKRKDRVGILENETKDIILKNECYSLKMLDLNGRDLLDEDLAQGKKVGEMLDFLLNEVIVSPEKNNREFLLKMARTYKDGKI